MNMNVYKGFGWFDADVYLTGELCKDDAEKLSNILVEQFCNFQRVIVYVQDDLFAPALERIDVLVKKACAIATRKRASYLKGYYYYGYEYKNGRFVIQEREKESGLPTFVQHERR